jgi:hypothetical protein
LQPKHGWFVLLPKMFPNILCYFQPNRNRVEFIRDIFYICLLIVYKVGYKLLLTNCLRFQKWKRDERLDRKLHRRDRASVIETTFGMFTLPTRNLFFRTDDWRLEMPPCSHESLAGCGHNRVKPSRGDCALSGRPRSACELDKKKMVGEIIINSLSSMYVSLFSAVSSLPFCLVCTIGYHVRSYLRLNHESNL